MNKQQSNAIWFWTGIGKHLTNNNVIEEYKERIIKHKTKTKVCRILVCNRMQWFRATTLNKLFMQIYQAATGGQCGHADILGSGEKMRGLKNFLNRRLSQNDIFNSRMYWLQLPTKCHFRSGERTMYSAMCCIMPPYDYTPNSTPARSTSTPSRTERKFSSTGLHPAREVGCRLRDDGCAGRGKLAKR